MYSKKFAQRLFIRYYYYSDEKKEEYLRYNDKEFYDKLLQTKEDLEKWETFQELLSEHLYLEKKETYDD